MGSQPVTGPSASPMTRHIMPTPRRTAPGASRGAGLVLCDSVSRREPRKAAAAATAQLRNAARHPQVSPNAEIRPPPSTWPPTVPTPENAPKRLIAFSRAAPVRECWKLARICGIITAAARPCVVRAASRKNGSGASPTASEVMTSEPVPIMNRRRRPKRSPMRPQRMRPEAKAAENRPTMRAEVASLAPMSALTPGIATFETENMNVARNAPRCSGQRTGDG